MALIAEQVGITAGALYRHFENKAVLLEQVFEQSFEWLHTPVTQHDYDSTVDEVIALVSGRPYLSDLWTQEMRYLPEEMRRGLRARMRAWNQSLVPGLRSRAAGPRRRPGRAAAVVGAIDDRQCRTAGPAVAAGRARPRGARRAPRAHLGDDGAHRTGRRPGRRGRGCRRPCAKGC
ncbi:TetR/AcrR family transcriptional regulator [Actinomadura madurae]|nr:TetR/AcrR family transcriptional regulator [Actinomadura madurae]